MHPAECGKGLQKASKATRLYAVSCVRLQGGRKVLVGSRGQGTQLTTTLVWGPVQASASEMLRPDAGGATPLLLKIVLNTLYVAIWILLSGTVILYNKWLLSVFGFHYPITLTMWHMAFSAALAFLCVRSGYVPSANLSREMYMQVCSLPLRCSKLGPQKAVGMPISITAFSTPSGVGTAVRRRIEWLTIRL